MGIKPAPVMATGLHFATRTQSLGLVECAVRFFQLAGIQFLDKQSFRQSSILSCEHRGIAYCSSHAAALVDAEVFPCFKSNTRAKFRIYPPSYRFSQERSSSSRIEARHGLAQTPCGQQVASIAAHMFRSWGVALCRTHENFQAREILRLCCLPGTFRVKCDTDVDSFDTLSWLRRALSLKREAAWRCCPEPYHLERRAIAKPRSRTLRDALRVA